MTWRYREPLPSDFDTEDEYEKALTAYDNALDNYIDQRMEEYYENR